ncbi:ABC transporter ATP-binding protein [uncultured Microbacterium sp.]|uniref:ABC transporter ATP-binding protein n=1 Tax=uncultured Microbacterium sp. TaxID=191216 RepID=UPI00261F3A3A|nr:ABC transporter ATP-binding protein [uncultured Microbacterium sp.]
MKTHTALSYRSVNVDFPTVDGSIRILRGVDLDVPKGSIVVLAGESGSGKSTAMLAAARLLPWGATVEGEVLVHDENITTMSSGALRGLRAQTMRVIFQDPWSSMHPMKRIGAQLVESAKQAHPDWPKSRLEEHCIDILEKVGIPEPRARMKSYAHQVSGGQLQRIVIAMCLVAEPEILLCDEPTTALDVTTQQQILDLLVDLNKRLGVTIVLSTHDISVIRGIADYLAVMYAGTVVEFGPALEVLSAPQHPYTWALLESAPERADGGRLLTIDGRPPRAGIEHRGCAFADRCTATADICRTEAAILKSITPERQSACLRVQQSVSAPEPIGAAV